jgi:alkylated DNA repair dioxygenase AlkB
MTELIPDLQYQSDFLTPEEEQSLVTILDNQPWLTDLRRRVQHYGYKYDYRKRAIDSSMKLGPLPEFFQPVLAKIQATHAFSPNQIIVNEYLPGQGISPHVDCVPCFGPIIMSLSLLAPCTMEFTLGSQKKEQWLEPRSLLTLQKIARYDWKHSIPARLADPRGEEYVERQRRLSLTFRTVIEE